MIITDIVPKRKKLSAIYIDGEYAVKIDTETILISKFSVGSEISDEELKELIESSNNKRAKDKALWLISYRDHSKKELTDKLVKTTDKVSAENAVERMEELGLINDEKYARHYANHLANSKFMSAKGIKYKLIEKGIDRELAEEIIDEMDIDPYEQICLLIEKKYRKNLSDDKSRKKVISALQRMGYNWSDINSALNNYIEEDLYEI